MRHALRLHPDSRCAAVTGIEVAVARPQAGELALHYFVTGKMSDVRLPPVTAPARTDELWRHTCLEAFVRAGSGYLEFNFSPSTAWAAYRFSAYRAGMAPAMDVRAPRLEVRSSAVSFEMEVLLALPDDATGPLGLSAVIEETGGGKSYWALVHPPGRADFHHADCFALQLPAA